MNLISQDEINLLSDTKYKNYVNSIEKCLKNFESSTEWADLISSLGKLKKILQSYPKCQYIPKRISVCKRLSQCLHPALPSGVHLKALEVYTVLFQNIGHDNLSKDLFLYSSGLFPLLEYAALSVKPILLGIYEQYFLPLKKNLRPCLTGLILAVLPGLEEGSDLYQRAFDLLKSVSKLTGNDYFFTCMWSAMLFSSTIRFPAIQYILAHFDRKKTMEDQLYIIGNSIDTMVNSICNCLQDTNSLVQRSILDFILQCLPIHNNQITRDDKIKLIKIAIHLVLRRDMSLNRRLYAWFLGQDSNGNLISLPKNIRIELQMQQTEQDLDKSQNELFNPNIYFKNYSQNLLITSIKSLLSKEKDKDNVFNTFIMDDALQVHASAIKMIKIISSLIEKQEIGQLIVEEVLLDLLLFVYKECESLNLIENLSTNSSNSTNNNKDKNEIIKATSNFIFQSFQLNFIWDFCSNKFEQACVSYSIENGDSNEKPSGTMPSLLCDLYSFILDLTNLDVYTEIQTEYLPIMLKQILITLNTYCNKLSNQDLNKSFVLCLKILKKIVPKDVSNVEDASSLSYLGTYQDDDGNEDNLKKTDDDEEEDNQEDTNDLENEEDVYRNVLDNIIDIIEIVDENLSKIENNLTDYKINKQLSEDDEDDAEFKDVSSHSDYESIKNSSSNNNNNNNSNINNNSNNNTTDKNSNLNGKCTNIIQICVFHLKQLIHNFIHNNIIDNSLTSYDDISNYFTNLFHSNSIIKRVSQQTPSSLSTPNDLTNDFTETLDSEYSDLNQQLNEKRASNSADLKIKLKTTAFEYLTSFKQLNKFLIKLFLFPRAFVNLTQINQIYASHDTNQNYYNFEDWLKDLFVISCLNKNIENENFFEFQSITINTLLEFFFISESFYSNLNSINSTTVAASTVNDTNRIKVLVTTVFTHKQLNLIYNESYIGNIIGQKLWSYLSHNPNITTNANIETFKYHKRAATLFCLLHELLPNNLCENIISKCLNGSESTQLDTIRRFIHLWHWSKEIQNNTNQQNQSTRKIIKTFERCVFMLIDLIDKSTSPVNKLIQEWLNKSITDGDLCRILDILIISLLHPNTTRVSVQFFNVLTNENSQQKGRNQNNNNNNSSSNLNENDSFYESKVYAISNEKGNVVYHINNEIAERLKTNSNANNQNSNLNPSSSTSTFLLTSLPDTGRNNSNLPTSLSTSSINTKSSVLKNNYLELPSLITNPSSMSNDKISLRVNPFGTNDENEFDDTESNEAYLKRTLSENNFIEKYRAMKLDLEQQRATNNIKKDRNSPTNTSINEESEDYLSNINSNNINDGDNINNNNNDDDEDLTNIFDLIDENYSFMLLYNQSYDNIRVLFVLKSIDKILKQCKKEFLLALCKTKICNTDIQTLYNTKLLDLFIRHLKSIYGYNFYSNNNNEFIQHISKHLNIKNLTYFEIILFILLFYIRSSCVQSLSLFSNNNGNNKNVKLKKTASSMSNYSFMNRDSNNSIKRANSSGVLEYDQDICGNKNVQIYCLQILTRLIQELIFICQNLNTNTILFDDLGQFNQYVYEVLERCKVQKTLLHCLFSTTTNSSDNKKRTLTKLIIDENLKNVSQQTQYAFICELINCIQNLINLEYVLSLSVTPLTSNSASSTNASSNVAPKVTPQKLQQQLSSSQQQQQQQQAQQQQQSKILNDDNDDYLITKSGLSEMKFSQASSTTATQTTRYIQYLPIISQSMFISSVLYYLRHLNLFEFHLPILNLIRNSLPYTGTTLKSWSAFIIEQLGSNLMQIVGLYEISTKSTSISISALNSNLHSNHRHLSSLANINIPDFFVLIIKQLSCLLHFSLLSLNSSVNSAGKVNNPEIDDSQNDIVIVKPQKQQMNDLDSYQAQAKDSLINLLPTILSRMTHIWKAMSQSESFGAEHSAWFLGNPRTIKNHVSEMLAPIAANHGIAFTIAIGTVWGEKKKKTKSSAEHKVLIELIRSLKSSFSISFLIQNISEIIKNSNLILKEKKKSVVNIWLLQFLHSFKETMKPSEATNEFYSQLCAFFKECIFTTNLLPLVYFQLFRILHDSVSSHSVLVDDKKYSKDIQEATHKLVDLCNSYVASSLQQTNWLRKNYAVKLNVNQPNGVSASSNTKSTSNKNEDFQNVEQKSEQLNEDQHIDLEETVNNISDSGITDGDLNDSNNNIIHSYQALNILAEYLAKTLDIVYKSDEKERLVVPVLYNVMNNIWPYLKTHLFVSHLSSDLRSANMNNFHAASQLLMNLTNYPYTRKTWKKEVFEMLFDTSFFYVDSKTLNHWKVIIDNLISNDRTMFKDVIVRVTYPQSSGLFTSREHEAEQKSQLLKRLAFVIFASEKDQYQRNMPEIQECVSQVLKVIQSANIYATLFLLFRVLLLRISSRHLICLWPTMLSELILILLQIEQDLIEELDNNKSSKPSILETLTYPSINISNITQSNSVKLNVYLSACKLIDLILTLPNSLTAQFQLYKWSFLNVNDAEYSSLKDQFVPYLVRINHLLKLKYPNHKAAAVKHTIGSPIIKQRQIQIILELKPFFDAVTSHSFSNTSITNLINVNHFKLYEQTVHDDFNEGWTS